MPDIQCTVLTGVNAAAIREAFIAWKRGVNAGENVNNYIVVTCQMVGANDLLVFYYATLKY